MPSLFSERIPSHLGPVKHQTDVGKYWLKRLQYLMKKVADLDSMYGKKLYAIMEHEKEKVTDAKQEQMPQWWRTLHIFHDTLAEIALGMTNQSNNMMVNVINPLNDILAEYSQSKETIESRAEIELKRLDEAHQRMKRAKHSVDRCTKQKKNAVATSNEVAQLMESEKKNKRFGSILTNFSKHVKARIKERVVVTPEEAETRLSNANDKYAAEVERYNLELRRWQEETVPFIQQSYETLELKRLGCLKDYTGVILKYLRSTRENILHQFDALEAEIERMDPMQDIEAFVSTTEQQYGPPVFPAPCESVLASRHSGSLSHSDHLFSTPLDVLMNEQREQFPSLPVPRIMVRLIQLLKESGGLESEGIFRVSPSGEKLAAMKERIVHGDYTLEGFSDPYIASELLKQWFREINVPIIGSSYDSAIRLANTEESMLQDYRNWMKNLNQDQQSVLLALFAFIQSISDEQVQRQTKMSTRALAIVFAPGIIRPLEDDPILMFSNVGRDVAFLMQLIEAHRDVDLSVYLSHMETDVLSHADTIEDDAPRIVRRHQKPLPPAPAHTEIVDTIVDTEELRQSQIERMWSLRYGEDSSAPQ